METTIVYWGYVGTMEQKMEGLESRRYHPGFLGVLGFLRLLLKSSSVFVQGAKKTLDKSKHILER